MTPFRHAERVEPKGTIVHGPIPPFVPFLVAMAVTFVIALALSPRETHAQEIVCGMNGYCTYDDTAIRREDIKEIRAEGGRIAITSTSGKTWWSHVTTNAPEEAKKLSAGLAGGTMVTATVDEDRSVGLAFAAYLVMAGMLGGSWFGFRAARIVVDDTHIEAKVGNDVRSAKLEGIRDVVAMRPSQHLGRLVAVYNDGSRVDLSPRLLLGGTIHDRAAARLREILHLEPHEGDGLLLSSAHRPSVAMRAGWLIAIAMYGASVSALLVYSNARIAWVVAPFVVATLLVAALRRYELPL